MTLERLKERILEAMGWCPEFLTEDEEKAARDFFETLDSFTETE